VELIHAASKADVVDAIREAGSGGRRVLVVGGRRHIDKGNRTDVDAELWTTQLDRVVSYEPAEMVAVVEAGLRVGELARLLADGGQEWPVDAPAEATVGGVIASGVSSPRRLRVGPVRDTVLEVEMITGDGTLVKGGGRTVKNVSGYDLPRLATGTLGTLGVIVQVALKLRPLPKARRNLRAEGVRPHTAGPRLLDEVPMPAGVLASPDTVEIHLEGWPEEVEEQAARAVEIVPELVDAPPEPAGAGFPIVRPWDALAVVVEAAVPPSRVFDLSSRAGAAWGALLGVGTVWCGFDDVDRDLSELRAGASALGGIAPVIRGPGGLGDTSIAAIQVQRRLKHSFDPEGVLAPGRGWGGI